MAFYDGKVKVSFVDRLTDEVIKVTLPYKDYDENGYNTADEVEIIGIENDYQYIGDDVFEGKDLEELNQLIEEIEDKVENEEDELKLAAISEYECNSIDRGLMYFNDYEFAEEIEAVIDEELLDKGVPNFILEYVDHEAYAKANDWDDTSYGWVKGF